MKNLLTKIFSPFSEDKRHFLQDKRLHRIVNLIFRIAISLTFLTVFFQYNILEGTIYWNCIGLEPNSYGDLDCTWDGITPMVLLQEFGKAVLITLIVSYLLQIFYYKVVLGSIHNSKK